MSVAPLTDLRSSLAQILAPATSGDPPVIPFLADAVAPPAIVIAWGDPWLERDDARRNGQCRLTARLLVNVVTTRIEPESGTPELETMISRVLRLLGADPYPWAYTVGPPSTWPSGGVAYYCAVVNVTAPTVPNEEV